MIEIHGANAHQTFTKTRTGCRGIVMRDSLMLISHEVNADMYLIPGGGLEDGETPGECCAREIREETGYLVKPVSHFLAINEYYEEYKYVSLRDRGEVGAETDGRGGPARAGPGVGRTGENA